MRYHYLKPKSFTTLYGKIYECNHPVYDRCTLFIFKGKGLAVVQQRIDDNKRTYWDSLDDWIPDLLYLHPKFRDVFKKYASEPDEKGLYPTLTVRKIMWMLRMKPLPKERWETTFDRTDI